MRYLSISVVILLLLSSYGVPCEITKSWHALVNHHPSKEASAKLYQLKGFMLQRLESKGGKILNLDYFPVTINAFPNNPTSGKTFTPEEFLTYLRLNFNDFVNQKYATFSPSIKTGYNEDSIWKSANPLGAIIHIHIPLPAGDGSVICTEYASDHWVYATLKTPWRPFSRGYDGKHPVSGYRQVGFTKNDDGSYTYYTRGVDKISSKMQARVAETVMKNPFKGADKLWHSLQNGIYDFVVKNGGTAQKLESTPAQTHHYRWRDVQICLQSETSSEK